MGRIFGTDGARGVAGTELTADLALSIGRAAAMTLTAGGTDGKRPLVLIGKDPRRSSDMLEDAVAAGLTSVGADVLKVGVLPTPAVAYLVCEMGADAGVMISASHNPAQFNGIKLFGGDGFKLPDAVEELIEAIILDGARPYDLKGGAHLGRVLMDEEASHVRYVDHIASRAEGDFTGMRVLVDCANGAASHTAGMLMERLGIDADIIYNEPDGLNINDGCGSTHIDKLGARVRAGGYDLGLAFDGDADRLLAVDARGEAVSGDQIMAIVGSYLKGRGRLAGDTVVVTPMTNMGFMKFAEQAGIKTAVTKVGDRYILEYLRANGLNFGGEQSGHVICLDYNTTGDGQLSAVLLLSALAQAQKPIGELKDLMRVYPQVLLSLPATPAMKAALTSDAGVRDAIAAAEAQMAGSGRVDVRPSGTEPIIRVMVEGEEQTKIEAVGHALVAALKEILS